MNGIIDFHTHAFPDELSERVIKMLEGEGGVMAHHDGKISSLLSSMDDSGIEKSVICNIATHPGQFQSILSWCKKIRSERIIPFPSFHPYDPDFRDRIEEIRREGFRGIKFHPYYQNFIIDEEKLLQVYEKICDENLILVMHTGFDFAFPLTRIADPEKISRILGMFPSLRLVTTHLGAWKLWEEVEQYLLGKPVYMEISFSLDFLEEHNAVRKIFFESSSGIHPFRYGLSMDSTGRHIVIIQGAEAREEKETLILRENALTLLNKG